MKWLKKLGDKLQRLIDDIRGKIKPAPPPAEPELPTNPESQPGADDAARYAAGPNAAVHGKNGFLWKPISESDGRPVVLLPPRFTGKTGGKITVNGMTIKTKSVANGYREHYPVPNHVDGPVTVGAIATDGLGGGASYTWAWYIPDGRMRWDSGISPTMKATDGNSNRPTIKADKD